MHFHLIAKWLYVFWLTKITFPKHDIQYEFIFETCVIKKKIFCFVSASVLNGGEVTSEAQ